MSTVDTPTSGSVWQTVRTAYQWLSLTRRRHVGAVVILSVVGAAAELATIGALVPFIAILANPERLLSYPLVSEVLRSAGWAGGQNATTIMALLFVGAILTAAALRLSLLWAITRVSQAVAHDLARAIYHRVLHQSYHYHIAQNSSQVIAVVSLANAVMASVVRPVLDIVSAVLIGTVMVTGLVSLDWQVATSVAGGFALSYLGLLLVSKRRVLHNSRVIGAMNVARVQVLQEGLGGIRDTILDRSQHVQEERFREVDDQLRLATASNALWAGLPRHGVEALGVVIVAGVAVTAAERSGGIAGALPVLAAMALGAQRLLPLYQTIYASWSSIAGGRGSFERVQALMALPLPYGSSLPGNPDELPFSRDLHLKGVSFRYRSDTPWVFRGFNLVVRRGSRIGFVGRTGCGKSTLLDIIMGLLDPSEGSLEVDGRPLTPANLRHWQARIAHVPQAIFLVDASIEANIAFGVPEGHVDRSRVEQAATRAQIHEFITGLADGYGTHVGERGIRLSGGQRQRIGIARALYRNADVLVLDEATSALDGETEASVMADIDNLGRSITVMIVAHRLTTLEQCDQVIRFDENGLRDATVDRVHR